MESTNLSQPIDQLENKLISKDLKSSFIRKHLKKLLIGSFGLIVILFIIVQLLRLFMFFNGGGTVTTALKCVKGGAWVGYFSNGCANFCQTSQMPICTMAFTAHCSCVAGKCWDGNRCISKPILTDQTLSPSPISLNSSPTPQSTSDWPLFEDFGLKFNYPKEFTMEGYGLYTDNKSIRISVVKSDGTMMNECMRTDSTEKVNNFIVMKFSRVVNGTPACGTGDSTEREIWIVPSEENYAPGISYYYKSTDPQAEIIFNQILSTFTFK